jgi:N-sulfoglucosamine sulfohydrolase
MLARRWWLGVALALVYATPSVRADQRLNLLLITADDLNGDSMGWMGARPGTTPHIDALAAGAHRFAQMHTTAALCQPSRSALLTGRVPHRNGALGFNPVRDEVPTLVERLSEAGYFTAVVEKTRHTAVKRGRKQWHLVLGDGVLGRTPRAMGEAVSQALAAAAAAKKPFFVNANITDPHRPFSGTPKDKGSNVEPIAERDVALPSVLEDIPLVRKEVAQYFGSVRRFDQAVGAILRSLEASGQGARTLVVFISDHGMSMPFAKATVYRNGTWTPSLLRWPGMPRPVAHPRHMVSNVDLLPTILEILQLPRPDGLDGRSLLPLMRGETQPGRDHVVTHINTNVKRRDYSQRCVRTKALSYLWQPWSDGKLPLKIDAFGGLTFKAMQEAAKTDARIAARVRQCQLGVPEQLFDLEKDPDERHDLIADPRYQEELRRLRALLLEHMRRTNDPLRARFETIAVR